MKKTGALLLALCLALCLAPAALAEGVLAEAPLDAGPAPQEAAAVLEGPRPLANAAQAGDFSALTGAIAAAASEDPANPTVIEVTASFDLTGQIIPPADKCVKLTSGAGGPYTLTMASSFPDAGGFSVERGGTLILEDLVLDGNALSKPIVFVGSGHLVIENGAVLQNSKGVGVYIRVTNNNTNARPATSVVMNGGEIKNNAGGGIDMNISMMIGTVRQELSLTVNGGRITGNGTEGERCGGIYARKLSTVANASAKVTIAGGTVSGNKAKEGGGIFVDCPFEMTDGEITGNAASLRGGGIHISENQQPVITGGAIAGNTAAGKAGSPEKGKGENICTRSDLKLGGGVKITSGVFLYGHTSGEGHAVLLLDGELQNPLALEGTYRVNPKPMVNMPVAKTANGQAMSQATFEKLSLAGTDKFSLVLGGDGVVRLGNAASGQPLIFYSTYGGYPQFGGTAPSQSGTGWAWDKGTNTLTLSGAQVSTGDSYALCLPPDAKIVLQEGTTSSFTKTGNYYAVFADGALEITGKGKLVVNGSVVGISAEGPITLDGCEVDATGTAGGIYGYADVTVTGCTLKAMGGIAIENGGKLKISDTDAVIDGGSSPAIMVMIDAGAAPSDYIKLADLPGDMQIGQAQDGGIAYATVANAQGNTVTALTLQRPVPPVTDLPVPDTALALDKTSLTLEPGHTAKLKATLTPADATYKYIFWESSDETVATVSDSGLVTAVAEGAAAVTAKSWYGNTAACTVTVKKAETPPTPPPTPPEEPWPTEELPGFVTRCYREALGREPDKAGHEDWVKWLQDGTVDAASCVHGFVFSKEMNNKNLPDEEFIKTLYRLFMDREGEAGGVAFWTDYLKTGHSREEVFGGFADSAEFERIKAQYGIR